MTQKAYVTGSTFPPTQPGLLRIYSMRFCPYAQRTRLVLAHKNIQCETVNVDLKKKPEWFLATSSLGAVPVLQLDDKVLPESTATCDWLDELYPDNKLQPEDPYRRAWDRVLHEYTSKLTPNLYKSLRAEASDIPAIKEDIEKHLGWYENQLKARGSGPFFGGASPAMIDFLLWPFFERIPALDLVKPGYGLAIDFSKFPLLSAYNKAMWELPAVKATGFSPEKHSEFYKLAQSGTFNYDMFLEE